MRDAISLTLARMRHLCSASSFDTAGGLDVAFCNFSQTSPTDYKFSEREIRDLLSVSLSFALCAVSCRVAWCVLRRCVVSHAKCVGVRARLPPFAVVHRFCGVALLPFLQVLAADATHNWRARDCAVVSGMFFTGTVRITVRVTLAYEPRFRCLAWRPTDAVLCLPAVGAFLLVLPSRF